MIHSAIKKSYSKHWCIEVVIDALNKYWCIEVIKVCLHDSVPKHARICVYTFMSMQEIQKQLMKCCEVDKKVQNPISKNVLEMLIKYNGVWLDEKLFFKA